jgi:hypothetical protein
MFQLPPTPIAAGKLSVSLENCCVINENACIVFLPTEFEGYKSRGFYQ